MNSTDKWRGLLVVVNLSLIGLIAYLCYATFAVPSKVPGYERTQPLDPAEYAVKQEAREDRPLSSFRAIWTALRPAPPPPPVIKKPVTPVTPKPTGDNPTFVKQNYDLLVAAINNADPTKSSCYLKPRSGPKILVKVGEKIPQTQLTLVGLARETKDTVKAWVKSENGKKQPIQMREKRKP